MRMAHDVRLSLWQYARINIGSFNEISGYNRGTLVGYGRKIDLHPFPRLRPSGKSVGTVQVQPAGGETSIVALSLRPNMCAADSAWAGNNLSRKPNTRVSL